MPSAVITGTPPNACMAFFDLLNGEKFDKTEEGTNLTNLSTGSDQGQLLLFFSNEALPQTVTRH